VEDAVLFHSVYAVAHWCELQQGVQQQPGLAALPFQQGEAAAVSCA
jgi:hypothetical protein